MAQGIKKLTIAIPTYNRANYLSRCLQNIYNQFDEVSEYIEIIVCDNCSNDNTEDVINSFKIKGLPIQYYKNNINLGFDLNIEKCYKISNGDYIYTIGDDDFIKNGLLKLIIDIIQKNDFGVIYMEGDQIESEINILEPICTRTYKDSLMFLKKITHNATFISAIIVKRELISSFSFQQYVGTQIAHFPFVLDTILKNNTNCYIETKCFNYQDNNSDFDTYQVFGANIISILEKYPKLISNIVIKQLILDLGNSVISLRLKNKKYFIKNIFIKLKNAYAKYALFWLYIFPLFIFPKPFLKIFRYFFIKIFKFSINKYN